MIYNLNTASCYYCRWSALPIVRSHPFSRSENPDNVEAGKIQMNDDVWIVTTPIISRLFSLLLVNQHSNSFAVSLSIHWQCYVTNRRETNHWKCVWIESEEQWFSPRWFETKRRRTSAILYLNYLFINHINGIAADERCLANANRCWREFCENNFLMNFEFHRLSSHSDGWSSFCARN